MAKCERVEVKPVPPPVEYVLTLSEREAKFLKQMTGSHVTGSGSDAYEISAGIYRAISDCGCHIGAFRVDGLLTCR